MSSDTGRQKFPSPPRFPITAALIWLLDYVCFAKNKVKDTRRTCDWTLLWGGHGGFFSWKASVRICSLSTNQSINQSVLLLLTTAATTKHTAGALSLPPPHTHTHTHTYALYDYVSLILHQHPVFWWDSVLISSLTVRIHAWLNCCGKHYTNYWCQYGVMRRQSKSIVANLVHSEVALLWLSLMGRQCFMAGSGFSEACRRRRMWITAQCSSTVLSWWLHLFWQALDCVWWWETAPGWHSAPALQLTMWIMETRRSTSIHQQTLRSH